MNTSNVNYKIQQAAIKEICEELKLIPFYPNYHGDKQNKNTVLIYTPENHEYNKKLPEWASQNEYEPYVCHLENSDINGNFNFGFMNHGKLDIRGLNVKEKIKEYILTQLKKSKEAK
jgi:hypothetical protein